MSHTHVLTSIKECLEMEIRVAESIHRKRRNGYLSNADFVVKNARLWTPQEFPLTKLQEGKPSMCYANAQRLAIDANLIYCEGYAVSEFIPVLHGWCVDKKGNVIDPTWTGMGRRPSVGTEYFGMAFRPEYIFERIQKTEKWWSLIDDWENDWPLYTAPIETWRHPINDL